MALSLRAVLPKTSPLATLQALPVCASPHCPRPASLWQRWWARREGIWLEEHWYCSSSCFHAGLYRRLEQAAMAVPPAAAARNRLPLGLILLSQGDITAEQLHRALAQQAQAGTGRLGEWLRQMGAVGEPQITAALAVQQACAVFSAREPRWVPPRLRWPESLARRYRALAVFHNSVQQLLYVGFLDQVDRSFLYTLEQMLHCQTRPCIVSNVTYCRQRDLYANDGDVPCIDINQRQSSIEMMRTIGNYADQVHAERCSIVRCADRLWIRLEPPQGVQLDLVFRAPTLS